LYVIIRRDRSRIVGLIRNYLPGYEGAGLVTGHDIEMLSSLKDRRQARIWARANGGLSAASAMGDYQLAATELALLHQKAHRGVISRRQFIQSQQGLLSLMQQARGQVLPRQPSPQDLATPWTGSQRSAFTQPMAYQAPMPKPPESSGGRPG